MTSCEHGTEGCTGTGDKHMCPREEGRLTREDEEAVARYVNTVESGRKKGVKQVVDWLLNEKKITYYGKLIPMKLRRMFASVIYDRFGR